MNAPVIGHSDWSPGSVVPVPGRLAMVARVIHGTAATSCLIAIGLVGIKSDAPMTAPQLATFYGVPGAMFVFFFVGAMVTPVLRLNMILLPLALVCGLIFAELGMHVLPYERQLSEVAKDLGDSDGRSKLEVVWSCPALVDG